MDDMNAILVKVRISILENEMAYNKEMDKMLVAFKKRALWPDYFLMDDKSLIEQTLSKCKCYITEILTLYDSQVYLMLCKRFIRN